MVVVVAVEVGREILHMGGVLIVVIRVVFVVVL